MKKALQIGINYIGTDSELKGCINDVLNMKRYLLAEGYLPENIRVMTEASENPLMIPTAANIMREIKSLVAGATSTTELFFNYSGHGGSIRDMSGDETDKKDETICPLDYQKSGQITDDMLRMYLIDPLPVGSKITCLFDSCHSGTVMDLKYNWVGSSTIPGAYSMVVSRAKVTNCKSICISGCRDEQTSADAYIAGKNQGAMTYAFLTSIEENKKKRKRPSHKELIEDMGQNLRNKKYEQVPQMSSGREPDMDAPF